MTSAFNTLIRVLDVTAEPGGGGRNFSMMPGEAVWIREEREAGRKWLDWVTGIEPPPTGAVEWKDVDWRHRSADEAAAQRGRIGCVFAGRGLLANLDMDENVWLPAQMHRRDQAADDIEKWARFFGCWPLPQERAPTVAEDRRRRILWTRAFAGRPEALVLEWPLVDTGADDRDLLLRAVDQIRNAGCAIVWLDQQLSDEVRSALEPLVWAAPLPRQGA
ncbi:MAG: hypothetical protein PHO14_03955 [Kiritimatiellae bacterium]|nr:hypothetical protein [Kiritimatiellia bacterium]MDD4341371.1 hypothetical protein [Kiritimatiellia bacterium]